MRCTRGIVIATATLLSFPFGFGTQAGAETPEVLNLAYRCHDNPDGCAVPVELFVAVAEDSVPSWNDFALFVTAPRGDVRIVPFDDAKEQSLPDSATIADDWRDSDESPSSVSWWLAPHDYFRPDSYVVSLGETGEAEWEIVVDCTAGANASAFIDIKPGSHPNPLNLASRGVLPVAVFGTDEFEAGAIFEEALRFGDPCLLDDNCQPCLGGDQELNAWDGYGVGPVRSVIEDVDGDGREDLLLHFSVPELVESGVLDADSRQTVLLGETSDGETFISVENEDSSVRIVPSQGKGGPNAKKGAVRGAKGNQAAKGGGNRGNAAPRAAGPGRSAPAGGPLDPPKRKR